MKQLPSPKVYEQEYKYMPWGELLAHVLRYTTDHAPRNGKLLDLMCGPGYLLGKIHQTRKDLVLTGVDIDRRYIQFAKKKYQGIRFIRADSRGWKTTNRYDLVLCLAGLHHLPYRFHRSLIVKLKKLLTSGGICILADPYIRQYRNEKERRLAAAELGYEYLKAVLHRRAPDEVVSATIDIMQNDILPRGEYKTSISRIRQMTSQYFRLVTVKQTWPRSRQQFGDYYLVLKK